MKKFIPALFLLLPAAPLPARVLSSAAQHFNDFVIVSHNQQAVIAVDASDDALVLKAAALLQQDISAVTGTKLSIVHNNTGAAPAIIIGSLQHSALVQQLVKEKKIQADSLNICTAEQYGIVIGTTHHEPLMRAHVEWRRYGKGLWNYDSNATVLADFWRKGMQRATNEKTVSVGMRVPDDITLLLCDDNWGNICKLPRLTDAPRSGGYAFFQLVLHPIKAYGNLQLVPVKGNKTVTVHATVKNTGSRNGKEVVERYVSHHAAQQDAIRSLKGFRRISLKAGESATVSFKLGAEELSTRDNNGGYLPFKGNTLIAVGGCQPSESSIQNKQTVQAFLNL